jgi:ferritin-like metal-binding protein YciE
MKKTKDELIDWLRDAYAMEKAMEVALEKQIKNEKASPALREQATVHLAETQGHADAVEACLKKIGADTSTLKTTLAQGMEIMKGLGTTFAKDERVKDVLAAYASEHFEIACYTALSAAAKHLRIKAIVDTCTAILKEEKRMANWLQKNLPAVVVSYLDEAS